MTELFEPLDAVDRRLALRATGLLRTFNEAGVLTAADVHVASRVGRLARETDERVLLAAALATRAVRHGSVGVDLRAVADIAADLPWPAPDAWAAQVASSPLLSVGVLREESGLLYLDRYWSQEQQLARDLQERLASPPPPVDHATLEAAVARVFPHETYDEQRSAARRAVAAATTILTGGPGTGKTTTVAGLLAILAEQQEATRSTRLRIALAAPTAKASARLQQAVAAATREFDPKDRARLGTLQAVTLHRLLGPRRDHHTRFRHHRGNRLPHDVVVVDESSMVSLTMMTRLVEAVRPESRLVLVGDPDQLASVEAGAVLADLVAGLSDRPEGPVVRLATLHRFGAGIRDLAAALRDGRVDGVLDALRAGVEGVQFVETDDPAPALRSRLTRAATDLRGHAVAGRSADAVAALDRHRLLCAHRDGPFGVQHWNRQVEQWLSEDTGDPLYEPMYVGRPLLVTANDYGVGVHNGDSGVVVRTADGARAAIDGAHGLMHLSTSRMSDVETMFATTIHKSQGSQAEEVTVLLPPPDSRLLTRELFYTAVTRAMTRVRVVGTEEAVRAAVERRAQRASGLRHRL
jgi:exodeoxyribonuclease V alpha subunit